MSVAKAMMSAARTAPKGCGVDNLEIAALGLSRLSRLARKMREIGERDSKAFFLRDADNVENSQAVVLIGTRRAGIELRTVRIPYLPRKTRQCTGRSVRIRRHRPRHCRRERRCHSGGLPGGQPDSLFGGRCREGAGLSR